MNIFQKDCPECTAVSPIDAVSCRCGYCFDPEALARTDPAEYAQQQDRLYRDYLAARIAQAEAELTVVREQVKADPQNTYKASGVLLAEQALSALQAEMKQLSLRIPPAAPRRAVPAASRSPVVSAQTTSAKPAGVHTPVKPIAAASKKTEAKPIVATAKETTPYRMLTIGSRPAVAAGHAPTQRSAAKTSSAPTGPAKAQPVIPRPSITAEPDATFKRLQAQRAEAIARAKAVAPIKAAERAAAASPGTKRPPQTVPARIPPAVAAPANPIHDCPNCTATVPADRKRCSCGYAFSRAAEELPAITLDATALAILTEGISATKSTTRRR